ncbi:MULTISPECIES: serine hydrolase [Chryseobacterium]|uniref:D-alanyl-D-alanine carboxypeptidase n=1 Tax=Chryseobacterium geocarposphaerae TaxID=1416776 RepID=A0ABU1LIL2_9FLAO|nr:MULTISPECIES: serine hydrolase domain-containing protein [Chryseobacterium]MDR6406554.1 D-alanyl-D-alanine carboxypeptidase [Chryseobacterium geocarposphaerae]MDR6699947.1 D-alanyl-D-alanine carboxypeptidase [Chryseobacterium ginsenosidimutans]
MFKKLLLLSTISLSTTAFSQNNVKEKLGNYLDSLFVHHKVMGSFAFAENNQPTFIKVVGFSDIETKQKANMNTQYRIGSISKTFTAVLIMKAVEDKKLSLDKKLSDFYPDIPNADKITIENLLQHRTGIHNLTNEAEYWQYNKQPQTESSLVNIIKKYKSDFEPGSKHEYSNSNYILLGFILEKAYKKSYADLIKDKIARPLKLTLTEVGGKIGTSKNQAKSYQFTNGNYQISSETDMSIPIGAGNIISTPTELLKFILGLEQGKLIKPESLNKMKNFMDGYGYGLVKVPFEEYSGFGHTGGIDNFRSALFYFPDLKTAMSFTTNQADMDTNEISIKMLETAMGKDFEMPSFETLVIPETELQKFVGNYSSPDIPLKINVFIKDKTLMAQATGQGAFPLEATSKTSFKFDMAGIVIDFYPAKKQFVIIQGGTKNTFTKE